MDDSELEGTLVLEQLAAIRKVEEFFDAIDAGDVVRAASLMREAQIDSSIIALVLQKLEEGAAEH